jgi:hypothetical protein
MCYKQREREKARERFWRKKAEEERRVLRRFKSNWMVSVRPR